MNNRVLRLVDDAAAFQRDGDDYSVCEFLFHSILAKTGNRFNGFVTSMAVSELWHRMAAHVVADLRAQR